jgi:uncharacterized protein
VATGRTLTLERRIAEEIGAGEHQVRAAVQLLDGGATVPFVARYRKEATGGLDDTALRTLEERLRYLRELAERRAAIVQAIAEQGRLDDALRARIEAADTKARLEDIYLPYKAKRRTKAQIAREAGLEPLADVLLADPSLDPQVEAARFGDAGRGVADAAEALAGARAILSERFGEDADLIGELRESLWSRARLASSVRAGREEAGAKFSDYFSFSEAVSRMPSHRVLALLRGEREDVLDLALQPEEPSEDPSAPTSHELRIAARFGIAQRGRRADAWLMECVRWAWRTRILDRLTLDVRARLRQGAELEAVRVFAANLRDVLLAAPAGNRPTMGLDPGLRTGVKVAVVDGTGKVLATDTVYPHVPHRRWDDALAALERLARAHDVQLVAIGNGTASRETDKLAGELVRRAPELGLTRVVVSEAGASVYSASAYAARELPGMDVSLRGAVSIARRLQDPLAELVKIDPKSIGVGQYQHDLPEGTLSRSLDAVVEDCVNAVGVDLNTASAPLLARVSGIGESLAAGIVAHRDAVGAFRTRRQLLDVPRLGPKAYQQCAGFLRIPDGEDPLDASAVHPEAYPVARAIAEAAGAPLRSLIGDAARLRALRPEQFATDAFGVPTIVDILAELEKPGRDPRPAFAAATFAEGVHEIADLRPGMILEGTVTNVAAFGAFVDVGVHQDGLVHVSAMAARFVSDPREVVKSGDVVKVKVMSVDAARKRIGLSLRLDDEPPVGGEGDGGGDRGGAGTGRRERADRPSRSRPADGRRQQPARKPAATAPSGAMADALRRAGLQPG